MEYLKSLIKSFFTLNKNEQKGIVIMFVLIFLLSILNFLIPEFNFQKETDFSEFKSQIREFRNKRDVYKDSLNLRHKQEKGKLSFEEANKLLKPFEFNPSTLDEFSYLKMGFSQKQYRTIKKYLDKGGRFYEKEDFKKIYCISDAEYEVVKPYIILEKYEVDNKPIKSKKKKDEPKNESPALVKYVLTEINSADSILLANNLKIKPYLIKRLIKYRSLLGGFYDSGQLLEVYGFPEYYFNTIKNYIEVDTTFISQIDINSVEFKTLLKHPYFDYQTTKLIFTARNEDVGFENFKDLLNKTDISDSLAVKMKHYLYFGRPK
ncbi:MAG: hypothetical protein C0595_12075 [Marinilabiliales bacterium]|nr:MAG: hypothetical protein C0595_12075 [Marinilabiliales bacterium]